MSPPLSTAETSEQPAAAESHFPVAALSRVTPGTAEAPHVPIGSIYDRVFWIAYVANFLLVCANTMTFRFAAWITALGKTEGRSLEWINTMTGQIVQTGVIVALVARFLLAPAIDRYGVRRVWTVCTIGFALGALSFALVTQISAAIWLGRIFFAVGLAGMFTCGTVHIQNHVPTLKRTEVLGALGSSGFLGMITGALITDGISHLLRDSSLLFPTLFGSCASIGVVYVVLMFLATRGETHRNGQRHTEAVFRRLWRYWPGPVVLVGFAMGTMFIVPSLFLTKFVEHEGLSGLSWYWVTYALVAFVIRVYTRTWSTWIGRHRMLLIGMTFQWLGLWSMALVHSDVGFLFPALLCGVGHAFLFPSLVSLGTNTFPQSSRGLGTTTVLGFFDVGGAVAAPLFGLSIDLFEDGAGYRQMFLVAGAIPLVVAIFWLFHTRRIVDEEIVPKRPSAE